MIDRFSRGEKMQPAVCDRPGINSRQCLRVKLQLRFVEPPSLRQLLGLDFVRLEIHQPDFSGQQDHQIRHALHDHKFILQSRRRFRADDGVHFRRTEFCRERQLTLQAIRFPGANFPARFGFPERRHRLQIQGRALVHGQNAGGFQAPGFRLRAARSSAFSSGNVLEKFVMRRARCRRTQLRI